MKNDARELSEIQRIANAAQTRLDIYRTIHKALRALMSDTLVAVGRMDVHDELELAQTTQRTLQMLDFLRSHLGHENAFIHPALEARTPGASEHIAHDHVHHEAEIDELAAAATALLNTDAQARDAAALVLYHRLSLFVAHNFEHMHVEESAHNSALWAHYTDGELVDLHNRLVASIPPEEMMFCMRWMVPFMNPGERAAVLADMRAHAPAPAFAAVLEMARPHLQAREWDKLMQALG
ncbi:MAG: hemerythrin domain-containing protein [Proteobacteria bacterium]|nr:hemerythrin domain-containing protein [Pseudomonadota bacterium]